MAQKYGGNWTILKLDVVRAYLEAYFKVMKRQRFKLCYIDAFAGSGISETRVGEVEGSALQALNYPFDRYYFIEEEQDYVRLLRKRIYESGQTEGKEIHVLQGDCNQLLRVITETNWISEFWRGVAFLDPYALDLDWSTLETIARTKAFDVWYLFPLSATLRCLRRDGKIDASTEAKIDRLLGTHEWRKRLYVEDSQTNLFEWMRETRTETQNVKQYIIHRLEDIFPGVLETPLELNNSLNSTMFLLCFACSNDNEAAKRISVSIAEALVCRANAKR